MSIIDDVKKTIINPRPSFRDIVTLSEKKIDVVVIVVNV